MRSLILCILSGALTACAPLAGDGSSADIDGGADAGAGVGADAGADPELPPDGAPPPVRDLCVEDAPCDGTPVGSWEVIEVCNVGYAAPSTITYNGCPSLELGQLEIFGEPGDALVLDVHGDVEGRVRGVVRFEGTFDATCLGGCGGCGDPGDGTCHCAESVDLAAISGRTWSVEDGRLLLGQGYSDPRDYDACIAGDRMRMSTTVFGVPLFLQLERRNGLDPDFGVRPTVYHLAGDLGPVRIVEDGFVAIDPLAPGEVAEGEPLSVGPIRLAAVVDGEPVAYGAPRTVGLGESPRWVLWSADGRPRLDPLPEADARVVVNAFGGAGPVRVTFVSSRAVVPPVAVRLPPGGWDALPDAEDGYGFTYDHMAVDLDGDAVDDVAFRLPDGPVALFDDGGAPRLRRLDVTAWERALVDPLPGGGALHLVNLRSTPVEVEVDGAVHRVAATGLLALESPSARPVLRSRTPGGEWRPRGQLLVTPDGASSLVTHGDGQALAVDIRPEQQHQSWFDLTGEAGVRVAGANYISGGHGPQYRVDAGVVDFADAERVDVQPAWHDFFLVSRPGARGPAEMHALDPRSLLRIYVVPSRGGAFELWGETASGRLRTGEVTVFDPPMARIAVDGGGDRAQVLLGGEPMALPLADGISAPFEVGHRITEIEVDTPAGVRRARLRPAVGSTTLLAFADDGEAPHTVDMNALRAYLYVAPPPPPAQAWIGLVGCDRLTRDAGRWAHVQASHRETVTLCLDLDGDPDTVEQVFHPPVAEASPARAALFHHDPDGAVVVRLVPQDGPLEILEAGPR